MPLHTDNTLSLTPYEGIKKQIDKIIGELKIRKYNIIIEMQFLEEIAMEFGLSPNYGDDRYITIVKEVI